MCFICGYYYEYYSVKIRFVRNRQAILFVHTTYFALHQDELTAAEYVPAKEAWHPAHSFGIDPFGIIYFLLLLLDWLLLDWDIFDITVEAVFTWILANPR